MFTEKLLNLFGKVGLGKSKYVTVPVTHKELSSGSELPDKLPKHVAIIMDGNGRWAKQRGKRRSEGHVAGLESLRQVVQASSDWGIQTLTVYAFSTENWFRPKEEVGLLMALVLRAVKKEIEEIHEKNAIFRIIGDLSNIPEPQRKALEYAMDRTKENTGLRFNMAFNYGGREDLLYATKALAEKVAAGEIRSEDINEELFEENLRSTGLGDVDLLIRTSGEERVSNFLPWQISYCEMIFNKKLWPDYDRATYLEDLWEYSRRTRRYGGVDAADDPEKVKGADE